MNGITYYRLKSDYTGDYTKNCALNGTEVDNNFYLLEGRDVKSIAVKDKDIVITLLNGDTLSACGVLDFAKTEDIKDSVVGVSFDKLNGILKITTADGEIQYIEGFSSNENTDFSVSTDSTIFGDGLRNAPLGIAPSARTGQYKTVKAIINVAEGGCLPKCGNILGDRYLTCEDISDYGYLYDYEAVRSIACELKETGWRIPTKEDWDNMLNAVEPCECDKNHDMADKNKFLGRWAGKLLKSKTMWRNCNCSDDSQCNCSCNDSCGCSRNNECGCNCNSSNDCDCGDDVCFDYSGAPCIGTHESESSCKCKKDTCKECEGIDAFGFRVTPAGYADDGSNFGYFRERAAFWTATTNQTNSKAYIKRFQSEKCGVYQDVIASNYHLSLRLVKDYDGKNYNEVEEVMDMEYPTLLLPSVKAGKMIWTASNFACGNASLHPMIPNNGSGITFTRHYFINEWNGHAWVRNEMKQGESVAVAKAPKGKTMVEYRVIGNDLLSVNEMIEKDVIAEVQPIIDELETKVTTNITEAVEAERQRAEDVESQIWSAINTESQSREEVESQLWTAINTEIQTREDEDKKIYSEISVEAQYRETIDNQQWSAINKETEDRTTVDGQLWTAINTESQTREDEDKKLYEALGNESQIRESEDQKIYEEITKEAQAREEIDNHQWEVIRKEMENREDEDKKLYEALGNESQSREEVDSQLWEAINTEIQTREDEDKKLYEALGNESKSREEVDGQLWTAINTERDERKAKDEEISGKLLTSEGTVFDSKSGKLTLKSVDGTNDINIQFAFNFGEF